MNERKKILTVVSTAIAAVIVCLMLTTWASPAFGFTEGGSGEGQNQHGEPQGGEAHGGEHQGEHQGEEHHGFNWWGFFGKMFDSTLLFGGLIYLMKDPLINLLAQKSQDIKTDIIEREELLGIKSTQLNTILERLEKIEHEVQAIRDHAEISGNEEQKRIEELGKTEAQRILALTEEEIGNKMEIAVRNLKERIADLTIEHFQKDIEANLDQRMHERLIEKNIDLLSGDGIERK